MPLTEVEEVEAMVVVDMVEVADTAVEHQGPAT